MPPACGGHGQATWLRPPYTGGTPSAENPLFSLGPAHSQLGPEERLREGG